MDDVTLILEVERRPVVYDNKDLFYKDNARKDKAWKEIAGVLGADVDVCKAKWRSLRDSFVKSRKKSVEIGCGGATRDWKYGEIMSFLLPYVNQRKKSIRVSEAEETESVETLVTTPVTTVDDSSVSSPPPQTNELKTSVSSPPLQTNEPKTSSDVPRMDAPREVPQRLISARPVAPSLPAVPFKRSKKSTDVMDRLMALLEEPAPKPYVPVTAHDESYHFALSLVPLLGRLTDDYREQAKMQILTTLHGFVAMQNSSQSEGWQTAHAPSQTPHQTYNSHSPTPARVSNMTQTAVPLAPSHITKTFNKPAAASQHNFLKRTFKEEKMDTGEEERDWNGGVMVTETQKDTNASEVIKLELTMPLQVKDISEEAGESGTVTLELVDSDVQGPVRKCVVGEDGDTDFSSFS